MKVQILAIGLTSLAMVGWGVGQECPEAALREMVEKARREAMEKEKSADGNPADPAPAPAEPKADPPAQPGARGSAASPVAPAMKTATVKRSKARVTGLLLRELTSSNFAANASGLSAVAIPEERPPDKPLLSFNQPVGPLMAKALDEVRKLIAIRHGTWPAGQAVDLGFDEKYSPKDGPSAAVACALLLDSMIADYDIDPALAVTGDVNADGTVQAVGGVGDKVRAAVQRKCTIVAIPQACETQVIDALVLNGPTLALQTQILTMKTFDQAVSYGRVKREPGVAEAMARFAALQTQLSSAGAPGPRLATGPVRAELQSILQVLPEHLSAKLLLMIAERRLPGRLSTRGSLDVIDQRAGFIIEAVKKPASTDTLATDQLANALTRLREVRPLFDARILPYADALANFGQMVREIRTRPAIRSVAEAERVRARLMRAAEAVDTALSQIQTDRSLMEDADK